MRSVTIRLLESSMPILRALSVRQPWVELILRGDKRKEYRSKRTNIRERVFLYASRAPADWPAAWKKVGREPGELPTGTIVGTVEILDCRWDEGEQCYAYILAKPKRLRQKLIPLNQAQPGFWRPRFA